MGKAHSKNGYIDNIQKSRRTPFKPIQIVAASQKKMNDRI